MKKIILLFTMMLAVAGVQAYDKNIDLSSPTVSGASWNAATNTITFSSNSGYVLFAVSGVDTYTSIDVFASAISGNAFGVDLIGTTGYWGFGADTKDTDAEAGAYYSANMKTLSANKVSDIGSITGVKIKVRKGGSGHTLTIPSICFKGLGTNSNTEGFGGLSYTGSQSDLLSGLKALPILDMSGTNYLLGNYNCQNNIDRYFDVTDYDAIYFNITNHKSAIKLRAFIGTSNKDEVRFAHKISDEVSDWTTDPGNNIDANGWYYISLDGVTALRGIGSQSLGSASERFTVSQMYLTKSSFTMTDGNDAMDIMYDPIGASVAYDRTFTTGKKATVCLPFDLTADQVTATGGKFYKFIGATASTLQFQEVSATTAYTPYIFVAGSNTTPFASLSNIAVKASAGATTTVEHNGFTFNGTLAKTDVASGSYGISNDSFVKAGTGVTIKAFRAYFTGSFSSAPSFLNIDFIDGGMGGTTGINEVKSTNAANDGVMYNLQGQRVNEGHKGLVIKNGKKVMMK